MELEYHPATVRELMESVQYFDTQRHRLGNEFRTGILKIIDGIAQNSRRYRVVKGDIRRAFVRRFSLSIFYHMLGGSEVRILVIRRHRLSASYGDRRR